MTDEETPPFPRPEDLVEPLPFYGIDDLARMKHVDWIVERVVQDHESTYVVGPTGSMKSLVTLDLLLHVASGLRWRGRDVIQVPTVLVCLENQYALPERVKAWREAHDGADVSGFKASVAPVRVKPPSEVNRLRKALATFDEPPLVAIDTQQRFAAGLRENTDEMQELIDVLDSLRAEGSARAIVLVHHQGKDPRKGPRGHTLLEASFTTVLETRRIGDAVRLRIVKSNNSIVESLGVWNLHVSDTGPHLEPAVVEPSSNGQLDPTDSIRIERLILDELADHPDGVSKNELARLISRKDRDVREALDVLDQAGKITIRKQKPGLPHLVSLPT